jgi:hypothetical protein
MFSVGRSLETMSMSSSSAEILNERAADEVFADFGDVFPVVGVQLFLEPAADALACLLRRLSS